MAEARSPRGDPEPRLQVDANSGPRSCPSSPHPMLAQNQPGLWSQDRVEWGRVTKSPKTMYPVPGQQWMRLMNSMAV